MDDSYVDYVDEGVISAAALQGIMGRDDVKIIDASFVLPNSPENPTLNYQRERIEGAGFFSVSDICDPDSPLPHMLPNVQRFEAAVSALGITNQDLVVVYGQSGMVMGPARAWWMFRVFGHDNVCILNGGLPLWKREGYPLNTAFPVEVEPSDFRGALRLQLVENLEGLRKVIGSDVQILDARPAERFSGEKAEPRAGMRAGHIPGSVNMPCMSLIDQETGMLKPEGVLREILNEYMESSVITSCGSGVTACVIALAFYALGRKDVPVYDGSWSEYGLEKTNSVVETSDAL